MKSENEFLMKQKKKVIKVLRPVDTTEVKWIYSLAKWPSKMVFVSKLTVADSVICHSAILLILRSGAQAISHFHSPEWYALVNEVWMQVRV